MPISVFDLIKCREADFRCGEIQQETSQKSPVYSSVKIALILLQQNIFSIEFSSDEIQYK